MKTPMIAVALLAAAALAGCGLNEPAVGKCTSADLKTGVELDVKIVDCGAADATTRIVKQATKATDCAFMSLQSGGRTFCAEPLTGVGA